MQPISAISLISYDAEYLPKSISRYYDYVDDIVLGLDADRISWNNNKFSFNEAELWIQLQAIDKDNKISIVEDNFHSSSIAIENDNFERNYLKEHCKHDWILSIDADEELLNANDFFYKYLPIVEPYKDKVDICMTWATPYKTIGDTTLVIANEDNSPFFGENQGVLTSKKSTYTYARWTDVSSTGFNRLIAPLTAIHWSLCRNEDALVQKINNTGHADLIGKDPFYNLWQSVTLENYHTFKNFKTSGLGNAQWPKLYAIPTNEVEQYYKSYIK